MGRPRKPENAIMVDMPCKVLPVHAAEIEAIAARTHRSKGAVARLLLLRGLAAYNKDRVLVEEEANHDASPAQNVPKLSSQAMATKETVKVKK